MNFAPTTFIPSLLFANVHLLWSHKNVFNVINAHLNVCIILQIPKFLNNNYSRLTLSARANYIRKSFEHVTLKFPNVAQNFVKMSNMLIIIVITI